MTRVTDVRQVFSWLLERIYELQARETAVKGRLQATKAKLLATK